MGALLLHERPRLRDRVRAIPKQSRLARQRTEARLTLDRSLDSVWLRLLEDSGHHLHKSIFMTILHLYLRLRIMVDFDIHGHKNTKIDNNKTSNSKCKQ